MKHGTIVLIRNRDWKDWLTNLVTRTICRATKSPFMHVEVRPTKAWYESTYPKGSNRHCKDLVLESGKYNHLFMQPVRELTTEEISKMIEFGDKNIVLKTKYNVPKLLALWFVIPLKSIFRKLKWVPFSDNEDFGMVCSVYVVEMFQYAGIDLFPSENQEYIAPGDFVACPFFEVVPI